MEEERNQAVMKWHVLEERKKVICEREIGNLSAGPREAAPFFSFFLPVSSALDNDGGGAH